MAVAKTGTFILTERVDLTSASHATGTIDLGSYVDVGSRQGIAIEKVDYTIQGYNTSNDNIEALLSVWPADEQVDMQLCDLTQSALQPNDNRSVISSGSLLWDGSGNSLTHFADLFPDNFGKLSDARLVVNDNLSFVSRCHIGNFEANRGLHVVIRIHAKIVKIEAKDWMAIAIQSTAADN